MEAILQYATFFSAVMRNLIVAAALIVVMPSDAPAQSSRQGARPLERHVVWQIREINRDMDEWATLMLDNFEKIQLGDFPLKMAAGEIREPLRIGRAKHPKSVRQGAVDYLLPNPLAAQTVSDPLYVRMPVLVRCRMQQTYLHCRAHGAYLGPPRRVLDIQWWHFGDDIPAQLVQSRFLELFEPLKDQPASR